MNLFKPDGVIYRLISRFTTMVLLSLLWLAASLPVVTIGASTAALYSVIFKILKDEDSHHFRSFICCFKANFKQATGAWLILLPVGLIIAWMYYLYFFGMPQMPEMADYLIMVIFIASVIYVFTLVNVFACAARYENTARQTVKNALFIGLRYAGRMIIVLAMIIAILFVCLWNFTTFFLGVIFAPAFICYVSGSFQLRLFERLESKATGE